MKRTVCVVCLLALFLSACPVGKQTTTIPEGDYDYGIYQLTFKTKKISNDHVGNDWSFTYTHNGQTIKSGYTITQSLEIFTFQSIGVEVRENDEIDGVGTGTLTVAICEVGSGKTEITVTETDGRYKGNTAVWEISREVELVGKK
ncbi:MAG: hypothetical protein IKC95_00780 [Oscillospiraceae bacterium]|nr:hypothetical protein [Oscillospiraceae bacterium]